MQALVEISTVLGGIAAAWFLVDKIGPFVRHRRFRILSSNPSTSSWSVRASAWRNKLSHIAPLELSISAVANAPFFFVGLFRGWPGLLIYDFLLLFTVFPVAVIAEVLDWGFGMEGYGGKGKRQRIWNTLMAVTVSGFFVPWVMALFLLAVGAREPESFSVPIALLLCFTLFTVSTAFVTWLHTGPGS